MSRVIFNIMKKSCYKSLSFKEITLEKRLIENKLFNLKNNITILKKIEKETLDKLKYYEDLEKGLKDF